MPETEAGDLLFGTVTGFSWKRTINKETLSADNHQPEWPPVPVSETEGETRRMEQYSFAITKGFSEATAVYTTTLEAWTALKEGEMVYFVQTPELNTWLIDQSGNPIAPVFRIQ